MIKSEVRRWHGVPRDARRYADAAQAFREFAGSSHSSPDQPNVFAELNHKRRARTDEHAQDSEHDTDERVLIAVIVAALARLGYAFFGGR